MPTHIKIEWTNWPMRFLCYNIQYMGLLFIVHIEREVPRPTYTLACGSLHHIEIVLYTYTKNVCLLLLLLTIGS